jgi:hypothetical protein
MHIQRITSKGQLVPLAFAQLNVAANQVAVALEACGLAGGATSYVSPFYYEIVGVSFSLSVAGTTGAFTIDPTIGGVANTSGRVTVGTSTGNYVRVPREKIRGTAGDKIGVKITTAAGWDGITGDLMATVWVLIHLDGV